VVFDFIPLAPRSLEALAFSNVQFTGADEMHRYISSTRDSMLALDHVSIVRNDYRHAPFAV
jgi:hypothetical protein